MNKIPSHFFIFYRNFIDFFSFPLSKKSLKIELESENKNGIMNFLFCRNDTIRGKKIIKNNDCIDMKWNDNENNKPISGFYLCPNDENDIPCEPETRFIERILMIMLDFLSFHNNSKNHYRFVMICWYNYDL